MKKYACVLFDVSQTLVMKTPTMIQRLDEALCALDVPHTMDEAAKMVACCEYQTGLHAQKTGFGMDDERFLSHLLAWQCSRLYPHRVKTPDAARLLGSPAEERYSLTAGAWNVLVNLKKKGIRLGVVCNGTASIRQVLEEMALTHFFDCIVISEEAGVCKPDPAIIRLACENCGATPEQTIYVGDHPFDVICAHAAGAQAAWMPSDPWHCLPKGAAQPEYLLQSLTELLEMD